MTTTRHSFFTALITAAIFFATDAQAVSLAPGAIEPLLGTTAAARPELEGNIILDTLRPFTINLSGSGTIKGTIQDRIVRSDDDGTLDFYFRIINDASSTGAINFVQRDGFSDFTADVDWRVDGLGGVAPSWAFREPVFESQITFFFANPIDPGEESRFFFVKSNGTDYLEIADGVLAGMGGDARGNSFVFDTFEPIAPIPLPAAVWLFGSGLVGLTAVARRKRRTRS
jgi:hypothetical protein